MTGNEYQTLAMRTNDHKATDRLLDKADMIDFFRKAKAGRDTENYDLGGILNACLGLSGEVGEFNDIIKKWIFHEKQLNIDHQRKKLAIFVGILQCFVNPSDGALMKS